MWIAPADRNLCENRVACLKDSPRESLGRSAYLPLIKSMVLLTDSDTCQHGFSGSTYRSVTDFDAIISPLETRTVPPTERGLSKISSESPGGLEVSSNSELRSPIKHGLDEYGTRDNHAAFAVPSRQKQVIFLQHYPPRLLE